MTMMMMMRVGRGQWGGKKQEKGKGRKTYSIHNRYSRIKRTRHQLRLKTFRHKMLSLLIQIVLGLFDSPEEGEVFVAVSDNAAQYWSLLRVFPIVCARETGIWITE